mgnify:CR=1 FL=1
MKKYLPLLFTTSLLYGNNAIVIEAPQSDITDHLIFKEDNENSKNNTLDEKLKNDISYFLVNDNHNKNSISFRGIKSTATNVIEDLIPSFKTTNGNIDFYYNHTMYDISSNMLITPSSLGVSSMGSDIELLTKKPKKSLEAQLSSSISQNDNEQKLYIGTKQKQYFLQLNTNRYDRDNYKISDDFKETTEQSSKTRNNSDKKQNSFELKAGLNLNDNDSISIKYKSTKSDFGVEPNIYDGSAWNAYSRVNEKNLKSIYGYYDHKNDDYEANIRIYFDNYKDRYDIYSDKTYNTLSFTSSLYDDTRLGLVAKSKFINEQDEISFVLKIQEDEHVWRRDGNSFTPNFKYRSLDGSIISQKVYNDFTIKSAVTYKDFRPVKVDYDGDTSYTQDTSGTKNDTLDYQIGLDYLKDSNLWYISHSKTTRTPSMSEMFAFFSWNSINPDLKAESSQNIELGYKRFLNYGLYSLSLYNYNIKNKIVMVNNQAENLNKAKHQGMEFRYENRYFQKHNFRFSYNYTQAKDSSGKNLELIPQNKLIIEDKININRNYSSNIQYIYLSKRNDDTNSGVKNLSSHSLVNIYLNSKLSNQWEATIGVKNLLDKYYESAYGYASEGRNIYGLITWKF